MYYLLDGHEAKPCTYEQWVIWMKSNPEKKRVAYTKLSDNIFVSTVFLGLNHNLSMEEDQTPLLLFETMIFRNHSAMHSDSFWRTSTWDEAVAKHEEIVRRLKSGELK